MARHACTNPPMLSQLFTETLRGKVAAVVYDFNVALPRVNTLPSPQSVKWNTRKDFVYISSERGFVLSNDDLERLIFQYLLLLSRLRVIFVRFFSFLQGQVDIVELWNNIIVYLKIQDRMICDCTISIVQRLKEVGGGRLDSPPLLSRYEY